MRARPLLRILVAPLWAVLAMMAVEGCNSVEHKTAESASDSTRSAPATIPSPSTVVAELPTESRTRRTSILPDSTTSEPRVVADNDAYQLRLPIALARLLNDSLPEFVPIQQSAYPAGARTVDSAPLSIAIGDFNGDTKRDVAIVGKSRGTPVFVMLLQDSGLLPEPRIVFLSRPLPGSGTNVGEYRLHSFKPQRIRSPDNPQFTLDLHTDSIWVETESLSTIWYWDNGTIRQFSIAGD